MHFRMYYSIQNNISCICFSATTFRSVLYSTLGFHNSGFPCYAGRGVGGSRGLADQPSSSTGAAGTGRSPSPENGAQNYLVFVRCSWSRGKWFSVTMQINSKSCLVSIATLFNCSNEKCYTDQD